MLAWLTKNWYFPLLFIGVGIAVLVGRLPGNSDFDPEKPLNDGKASPVDARQQALREEFDRAKAAADRNPPPPAEKDTDTVIAEHQAKLETDIAPEESAALLAALGNLHRQKKRDYAAAARYYEELIQKYPEWPGVDGIYHQLISCYTELNDQPSLRLLYRAMIDVFPPESKEYEYAQAALAGDL